MTWKREEMPINNIK